MQIVLFFGFRHGHIPLKILLIKHISLHENNQEDYDDVFKSDIWWPRQGGNKYIYLMADVNATFRADITVLEEKEIVLDFINHPEKCKLIASNAIINRDLAKLD